METGASSRAEIQPVPARVPGSVQMALKDAGIVPDWNVGMNARLCEWVENRHWIYETILPATWLTDAPERIVLKAEGLDYCGVATLNGAQVGEFCGSFTPHEFDLRPHIIEGDNCLQIVFEVPPRWLGQTGYTSQMTQWKPRFNYGWDWTARLVQIGIWEALTLEIGDAREFWDWHVQAGQNSLSLRAPAVGADRVRVVLDGITSQEITGEALRRSILLENLSVELWQPNGSGAQTLYELRLEILGEDGEVVDAQTRRVGFKSVEWRACENAPENAEPWLCVVNGEPLFLQGVNWTPIRPNFADLTREDYRSRLQTYRNLGFNCLRVWGGAFLEKSDFYELCDEMGFLVWQEFPLSSSGVENWPPEDDASIAALTEIARSYIARRGHHVSLLLWCGGNELQGALDGGKVGIGKPVDGSHPLLAALGQVVAQDDPARRFLPASSSGPRFMADEKDFGKGWHHDVHGPWGPPGSEVEDWNSYWTRDDALFRSETGAPGASSADIIRAYQGDLEELPATLDNPLWRRTSWWIEEPEFVRQHGREPGDLEEYVAWSQARQAQALGLAARACKARFPDCGGLLLWMGHDSFPCAANTSLLDFWGRPKPAALALGEVFRQPSALNTQVSVEAQ